MEYRCTVCNYETHDKSNFSKHSKSQKHIKKVNESTKFAHVIPNMSIYNTANQSKCQYCDKLFSNSSSLARHKNTCSEKKINELQTNHKINDLSNKLDNVNGLNKKLEEEVKYLKSLIASAGGVIKTSVSALAYVAKNYDGAPALKKLKDYSYIKDREDEDDEFDLMETLIYKYNNQILHEYLGNIIVDAYKKQDPTKQSIWNSDTTRLTYVIRELIDKKPDWSVDKKGIKTTKYIITPLLEFVERQASIYLDEIPQILIECPEKLITLNDNTRSASEIIANIYNKMLANQVLKYIAPHFYLAKEDLQLIE